jgi:exopolyphosphatase / guanosine-5'-triphosphate,3'-diphosphate pyrophosphatase
MTQSREHVHGEHTTNDFVAAIDIGTNSTNMLVVNSSGAEAARVESTPRLGVGVDAVGRFDPTAVRRTLESLESYKSVLDQFPVGSLRCVATSAARRASDFGEFATAARSILGQEIELIDGTEEGRLSYIGALSAIEPSSSDSLVIDSLVMDMGGGSTELAFGTSSPEVVRSLEVGVVRLTEKYLRSDPPLPEELVNAIADVQDLVADACREVPRFATADRVIGCSGTILTIAAVELGSFDVPSGFVLSRTAAEDVFRTVATESAADRIHNPGLAPQRVDIIVAGCCILVGLMRSLELDDIVVSRGNILDGICHELRGRL